MEYNRNLDQLLNRSHRNFWSGMAPLDNSDSPDIKRLKRRIVDSWGLRLDINTDVANGVWLVGPERLVNPPAARKKDGQHYAFTGHFLRPSEIPPPPTLAHGRPADSLWFRNCNKEHHGWALRRHLRQVTRHLTGPDPPVVRPQPGQDSPIPSPTNSVESDASINVKATNFVICRIMANPPGGLGVGDLLLGTDNEDGTGYIYSKCFSTTYSCVVNTKESGISMHNSTACQLADLNAPDVPRDSFVGTAHTGVMLMK